MAMFAMQVRKLKPTNGFSHLHLPCSAFLVAWTMAIFGIGNLRLKAAVLFME